ncbi:Semaphorin-4A [Dissostichus eleginoides]|uniref:Semaphorin-4A n=1 Tax=Dissostichus eleginoides TaxID=100907 RepID=A0AAD9BCA9_DISEL|nr:Semaphorin-4A [Dissostichus eleginoides]
MVFLSILPPSPPRSSGELVSVSLNEVVRLQCPAASLLSQQLWERPNSRLTPDLYLLLGDGSLSFVATPATLGPYLCLSTENGYQQTVAMYHVKQGSGPVAQTPSSNSWPQNPPHPHHRGRGPAASLCGARGNRNKSNRD